MSPAPEPTCSTQRVLLPRAIVLTCRLAPHATDKRHLDTIRGVAWFGDARDDTPKERTA